MAEAAASSPDSRRAARRWLAVCFALAVVLAAAPALASGRGANNHPAKVGHNNKDFVGLVDIGGGREMYMECRGKGSPTVVLVSGAGERTETWSTTLDPSKRAVLPAVAETNRVCAYDHPGTYLVSGENTHDDKRYCHQTDARRGDRC